MNRDELIQLSVEGKIKQKKKFLQEADEETIEKICQEYAVQQFDEANGQLADILVAKFSELMEKLKLIKSTCELEEDLAKNELLKNDVKKIVGYITPFVPFIGIISGGITVRGHVISKKMSEGSARTERTERSEARERKAVTEGPEGPEGPPGTEGTEE